MRRFVRLIAVFGLLLLAGVALGGAASPAQASAQQVCPHSTGYPMSPGVMIMASTTTPFVGQRIEVSGKNYCPDEDVTILLRGKNVGTAHTDASGAFDPGVKVTGPVGRATLLGRGASGQSLDRDSLVLTVRAGTGSGSGAGSPSGGGLAVTGTELAAMIVLAALLLGGGIALTVAGRRNRSVHR
ncbi:MAG: hypothetical protein ACRDWT_11450 [Jatrophihabitantaceae bacterium]